MANTRVLFSQNLRQEHRLCARDRKVWKSERKALQLTLKTFPGPQLGIFQVGRSYGQDSFGIFGENNILRMTKMSNVDYLIRDNLPKGDFLGVKIVFEQ